MLNPRQICVYPRGSPQLPMPPDLSRRGYLTLLGWLVGNPVAVYIRSLARTDESQQDKTTTAAATTLLWTRPRAEPDQGQEQEQQQLQQLVSVVKVTESAGIVVLDLNMVHRNLAQKTTTNWMPVLTRASVTTSSSVQQDFHGSPPMASEKG